MASRHLETPGVLIRAVLVARLGGGVESGDGVRGQVSQDLAGQGRREMG